jgi:hypothetical protein
MAQFECTKALVTRQARIPNDGGKWPKAALPILVTKTGSEGKVHIQKYKKKNLYM